MKRSSTMVMGSVLFAAILMSCGGGSTPDADVGSVPDTPVDEPDADEPADFNAQVLTCAESCEGDQDCMGECIGDSASISTDCASCFGAVMACMYEHCLDTCAAEGLDTPACDTCLVDNACGSESLEQCLLDTCSPDDLDTLSALDVTIEDVPDVVEPEPDVIIDVEDEVGPAPTPDVEPEVIEGPECVAPIDCINKLSDQFEPCETAACESGVCNIVPIVGCCLADEECPGYADACCETITCNLETSQCESDPKEGCCEASSQCNDLDPETNDFCATACEPDGCVFLPPLCDNDVTYMVEDFNDLQFDGLVVSDTDIFDLVTVSSLKGKTVSPERSLYFGATDCQTYYTGPMENCVPTDFLAAEGTSVGLEVTTDDVTLVYEEPAYLGFWVRMAAEPALLAGGELYPTDYLRVTVATGEGSPTVVWRSPDALGKENTTQGEWMYQVVDLEAFKGKNVTVTITFIADAVSNFNTGDGEAWYGAYVDDLIIRTACVSCVPGSLCNVDFDGCSDDTCMTIHGDSTAGLCTYHAATPGTLCQPCAQPGDCGDDSCVDYTCEDSLCGASIKPECCEPFSSYPYETTPGGVAVQGFEVIGIGTWTVDDPYPDDNVAWQVTETAAHAPPASLYFGDPETGTYEADPSNPAVGSVWTPSFQVSGELGMPTVLAFWLHLSTEYDLSTGPVDPTDSYDMFTIYLHEVGDEDPVAVWDSASTLGNSTHGQWQQIGIDVTEWADKFVRIGFEFDSGDVAGTGYGNNFGGVYIDELTVSVYCESECLSSDVCDDGNPCTTNACVLGACETTQPDASCCQEDADCTHDNSCVNTSCVDGQCEFVYSALNNCCSEGSWLDGLSTDFEDGAEGWTSIDSTPPVVWSLTSDDGHSGYWSYNFADPETGTYALGGDQTTGRLISPTVSVPPFTNGNPFAEFWLRMETEWDFGDSSTFEPFIPVDELRVQVFSGGNIAAATELWTSHYLVNTTHGQWVHTYVDLDDYRGEDVQLAFEFVSGDFYNNDYAGAFIDDVNFGTTCKTQSALQCFDGGDCVNNDECMGVVCNESFSCVYSTLDTPQCCEPTDVAELAVTFEAPALEWEAIPCAPADGECPGAWSCTSPGAPVDPSSFWKIAQETQAAGIPAKSGESMLYFGNGLDYGGAAGAAACGRAMSEPITIEESDAPWTLTYWAFLDIEPATDCDQGFGAPWLDVFTLEIVDDATGDSTLILVKDVLLCSEYGTWAHQTWDLTPWVGSTIRLRVGFNSWDQDANSGKGIALDEFRFERGCAEF